MQKIVNQPRCAGKTSSVRAAVSAAARLLRKAGYNWENGEWKAPARRLITVWARNSDFDLMSFRDEWARAMAADSRMPGLRLINLAEVQAESVPNLTPSAIAAAVCQRVAELDDRSSPADWPEAMLVTAEELQAILIEELAAALPAPQAQPADALDAKAPTLVEILAAHWTTWPAEQAVEQTVLGDVFCCVKGRALKFGTYQIASDQDSAVVTPSQWARQRAAMAAAQEGGDASAGKDGAA